MVVRSDWRIAPSAVERSAAPATAAMAAAAETLQSHLEFVLDERLGGLNAEQRRFLNVAVRYGDRLVRLVEDLRTVALAESGELELSLGQVDLAAVAQSALEHVWPIARVEGKTIELRTDGPVVISADLRWAERAVLGLVLDAVEAVSEGSTITIDARDGSLELTYEAEEPPSEVVLALADAVARVHGGELVVSGNTGSVSLEVRLEARSAVELRAVA
jgi:light-regulated signal transduction histidine kinase (bacteriophytochrome)